jgi:hypothetical protein
MPIRLPSPGQRDRIRRRQRPDGWTAYVQESHCRDPRPSASFDPSADVIIELGGEIKITYLNRVLSNG